MPDNRDITLTWRLRPADLLLALCAATAAGSFTGAHVTVEVPATEAVTPDSARNGWIAPDPRDRPAAAPFVLQAARGDVVQSSEGAVVKLWDDVQACTGGKHLPTYTQAVGDCVAHAVVNAVNYLQFSQLARGPPIPGQFEFRPAHRPFVYGVARTAADLGNKRLGRSDGCVVSWACEAVQRYGVLAEQDGPDYSGQLARSWGYNGVPEGYLWNAALFRVQSVARVETWEQLRDALANGYPVPFGGTLGFNRTEVRDGRLWGIRSGSWSHSMCWIAVDDQVRSPFTGKVGAVYVLNSWGPNAHPAPPDGAPPGGFWIDRATAEMYLRDGDCCALSNFDGFPAREAVKPDDFVFFDAAAVSLPELHDEPLQVAACEHYASVRPDRADQVGIGSGVLGVLALAQRMRGARRIRRRAIRHFGTNA